MHARTNPSHLLAILVVCSAISGCKDDPPGKLFDEQGAWAVVQYDIGEGLEDIMTMTRENAFMLSFDTENSVMTTAACGDEMSGFLPSDSTCRLSVSTTSWQCSCYAYAFQEDVMQMTPFDAGSAPPEVEFDPDLIPGQSGEAGGVDESGTGTGGESGGMSSGPLTVIRISPIPERMDTYDFTPLPSGVFGGNGANHHFIVEARSNTIFGTVYDDPQGRPSCEPCVPGQTGG
jgi:hypothetical protein